VYTRKLTCCVKCYNKFVFNDLLFVTVCLTITRHNVLLNCWQNSWLHLNECWRFSVKSLSIVRHLWGVYFHSHWIMLLIHVFTLEIQTISITVKKAYTICHFILILTWMFKWLSRRGRWFGLITCLEESYRVWSFQWAWSRKTLSKIRSKRHKKKFK